MATKKIATVLASASLLSSLLAFPADAADTLTDIDDSFAKNAIMELVDKGIINGKGDGIFDPTGKITRGDFAIILAKALNLDVSSAPAASTFSDVPATSYAYKYVEAAAQAGLINGLGDGKFGLNQSLTRQDMAVLFARALKVDVTGKGAGLTFSDADLIAKYAKDSVAAAVELGLMVGVGNNTFNPLGDSSREQVAVVASRFLKEKEKSDSTSESDPSETPESNDSDTPSSDNSQKPTSTTLQPPISYPSTGGGSYEDRTAPVLTLISTTPIEIGQAIVVTSNELGAVYLLPADENPNQLSQLENLVTNNRAKKAAINEINANTSISTEGLYAGSYKVYAADTSGNISTPSVVIELSVHEMAQPAISFISPDTIVFTYSDNLNSQSIPAVTNVKVVSEDESASPIGVQEITINGHDVLIKLSSTVSKSASVRITYQPGNAPIMSETGRWSPSVTQVVTYTPANQAPVITQAIPDQDLSIGQGSLIIFPKEHFEDPDGDELYFMYAVDNLNFVSISVEDQHLVLQPLAAGTTTVTLIANDGKGGTASMVFNLKVTTPKLSLSLKNNAVLHVNSGKTDTDDQITLATSASSSGYQSYQYDVQSINDLILIKRGEEKFRVEYDSISEKYQVIGENDTVEGTISIMVSDESLVSLTPGTLGMVLDPADKVEENSNVELEFHLIQEDLSDTIAKLQLTFDETAPEVTDVNFVNDQLIITVNEELPELALQNNARLMESIQIIARSAIDPDNEVYLTIDDYTITSTAQELTLTLTEEGRLKLNDLQQYELQLNIRNLYDYADNWFDYTSPWLTPSQP
ncbi:S-layer homology domain-containing protein [Paenibacillus xylaniclasticus]|uniref:S-layer homology domain-containing protein n=1 Tax=Paenibacillus xylaniclasticus TaxID=588083 RepID=UPI000FD937AA|nr:MULTISPECIES: S-layer homology domain-containing protein [Paenibacillus]GFN31321.1 hypothetical protein PCURB6_15810 [Paenibacillus curdlanolyticus]